MDRCVLWYVLQEQQAVTTSQGALQALQYQHMQQCIIVQQALTAQGALQGTRIPIFITTHMTVLAAPDVRQCFGYICAWSSPGAVSACCIWYMCWLYVYVMVFGMHVVLYCIWHVLDICVYCGLRANLVLFMCWLYV